MCFLQVVFSQLGLAHRLTGLESPCSGHDVRASSFDLWENGEFFPDVNPAMFSKDDISKALEGDYSTMFVTTLGAIGASGFSNSNTFISIDDGKG
jgi:hypothetical protein